MSTQAKTTQEAPKGPPSCWGCGLDWMHRWKPEDLGPHPSEADYVICPDCLEEMTQAPIVTTSRAQRPPACPKVNLRSKTTLPRFTDEQLGALAARVGLTLVQLKEVHSAAHQVYQYLGHDLGGGSRECIVEVVLDAGYVHHVPGLKLSPEVAQWWDHKAANCSLDHVYQAVGAGFPYAQYE